MTDNKRIAIFCVAYHSYPELYHYLDTIGLAAKATDGKAEVDVFVADNSDRQSQEITYTPHHFHLRVFPFYQNLGYFGAVRKMMEEVSPLSYDYIVISNVDIRLAEDTFTRLISDEKREDNIGWIAPQIFSMKENRDRNPKIMNRYALRKLKLLRLSYQYPVLHRLYTMTAYKTKRLIRREAGNVYAGHGSFIILTHQYFERCGIIDYPIFLFDEEIYLAEMCRTHQLSVYYEPQITVHDEDHVSTEKMTSSFYYQCNYEATNYIIHRFY